MKSNCLCVFCKQKKCEVKKEHIAKSKKDKLYSLIACSNFKHKSGQVILYL